MLLKLSPEVSLVTCELWPLPGYLGEEQEVSRYPSRLFLEPQQGYQRWRELSARFLANLWPKLLRELSQGPKALDPFGIAYLRYCTLG